ncbi:hypothetical protein BBOV_II000960 [Babesia bovis T2Bo]|uniref:hypothetical protein n=1 Tax=Babesia bovis T2Bo TaxID=484906 RepID=UPI001C36CC15|nr:hypothetical protein BBOV_II000960 [Babesia bovis T2Bo]EDO06056.2 hypothetical protein BBOV_II000960 [Babesia bovis T2Bo]
MSVKRRKATSSALSDDNECTSNRRKDSKPNVGTDEFICECCLLPIKQNKSKEYLGRVNTCPHKFHLICIKKWSTLETTCPQCKAVFDYIEKLCPITGNVVQKIKCKPLFLWDHDNPDEHNNNDDENIDSKTSESSFENPPAINLLSPEQVMKISLCKQQRKTIELTKAISLTERHVKRMELNSINCDSLKDAVSISPLRKDTIKCNTSFNLQPEYQADFIGK